jgi:hypothetical protein
MEKNNKIFIQLFLLVVFLLGLYVYSTYDLKRPLDQTDQIENMENLVQIY